jgi:hypothetical protein
MKSKWLLLGLVACLWAIPALSQSVEVTGEYSYFRFNPSLGSLQNRNLNGGGFDASFFLRPMFGIKADMQFYGTTTLTATFPTIVTPSGTIPAGTYSSSGTLKTYLFGPIVKARLSHFEPFGEILFGVAHTNAYANFFNVLGAAPGSTFHVQGNQNPFSMAVGGGIDLPVSHVIAIRLAELDYVLTRLTNPITSTNNQNHFRYLAGIQFRFGGK